jgi:predicted transcriptional regulator
MNRRLQVLIPKELNARVEDAARRVQTSKAAWVRQAIEDALKRDSTIEPQANDPLARLASLNAPTADIDDMIAEITIGSNASAGRPN